MREKFWKIPGLCALFLCFAVVLRAEFPPDTFPPDSGGQRESSEDESEKKSDEDYLSPKKKRQRKVKPRPVPREQVVKEPLEDEETAASSSDNQRFRISGSMGYANLFSFNGPNNQGLTDAALHDHFGMGLGVDWQFSRLFGFELEGFYAMTPTNEVVFPGPIVETRQVSELGGMLALRAEFPISGSHWRPKLLAGFGMTSQTQVSTGGAGGDGTYRVSMSGLFLGAGAEAQWPGFFFYVDAAITLTAAGTVTSEGAGGDFSNPTDGARFLRVRLGCGLELFKSVSFGPEVVLRILDANSSTVANMLMGRGDALLQVNALATLHL